MTKPKRPLPYTDLEPGRFKEYSDIELGSLWLFPSRDRTGGHHGDYHGNFIPQVAHQLLRRYSRPDDVIVDWFLGSGTSAIEALRLGRRVVGVEIKPEQVAQVASELPADTLGTRARLVVGDSASPEAAEAVREALAEWGLARAHLAILHPPYHDIIRFSDDPRDLSNCPSVPEFIRRFGQVVENAARLLEPGRFLGLVIGDLYRQGEVVTLGFQCIEEVRRAGFCLKSLVVKDIRGNEHKGVRENLWKYRALAGGFSIFKHEYVAVLQLAPKLGA